VGGGEPQSQTGLQSTTLYQHQSTLRLTLEALGITQFPGRLGRRQRWASSSHRERGARPGRVNLIGEHIDYCGSGLPMAIGRSVRMTFQPRANRETRLTNRDPRFAPSVFMLNDNIPSAGRGWSNYDEGSGTNPGATIPRSAGVDAVVESDLPIAAGLSSSSAMVVATALALLHANRCRSSSLELMDLLARGER